MVTVFVWHESGKSAEQVEVDHLPALLEEEGALIWVSIANDMEGEAMRVVRDIFHFHPLAIEDCFGEREHPKIEAYDGYVYLITHGMAGQSNARRLLTSELDAFVSRRYLVTYHDQDSPAIDGTIEMVKRDGGPLRHGPAAVLHTVLDRQTDGIEPVIDDFDDAIAALEDRVLGRPRQSDLRRLLSLRRNLLHLRRWLTRQREVVLKLARNEVPIGNNQDALAFRDVYDHLQRFTDLIESYRELTTSVQDAYLTVANNRLNEVMKFLTVFTAVLMPLTVIAGIYGMNFEHMPELHWRLGYPFALGLMVATGLAMIWYFRWRGWIGRSDDVGTDQPPPEPRDTIESP
jgi:magnesium transporter